MDMYIHVTGKVCEELKCMDTFTLRDCRKSRKTIKVESCEQVLVFISHYFNTGKIHTMHIPDHNPGAEENK